MAPSLSMAPPKPPMKQSHRIAKNIIFGVLSAVVGGLLNFISIFIVARFLGVKDFGIFSYLLAFATVFQFMADFGLSNILVREMARQPHEMARLMGGAKLLVWYLFFAAAFLMSVCLLFLQIDATTKLLSFVMGLGYLLLIHSVTYIAVLRATEDMEYNAIGFVLHKVFLVTFLIGALWMQWGLWGVVWCHFGANFLLWGYYHWIVTRRHPGGHMHYDWPMWKSLILETLPMGGGMALRQFTWQMDIFLLTYFTNPTAVGFFSGPFRIVIGLTLLPAVLTVPLFPLFVRLAKDSHHELAVVYQRAVKWFCLMGFPIMTACLAAPLGWIHLFLGEKYLASAPVLQMLSLAIVPVFLSVLYPFLYSALHIQKWFLVAMALTMVARLTLGSWVIPHYGYLGQCVVIDAVEIALFVTLAGHLSRMGLPAGIKTNLVKPLIASVVMGIFLYMVGNTSIIWTVLFSGCGSIIYLALLWLLGTFTPEEISHLRDASGFVTNSVLKWRAKGVEV